MEHQSEVEAPAISLQSKDHGDLLDIIDNLRSQGISRYVDLPQLIVCGDQSSGKSSVLEAVSGIRFPTKDNLCTRFATELILRRGLDTNTSVTIVPSADRDDIERAKLLEFQRDIVQLDQFESLVDDAKKAMGLDGHVKAFTNDILRVEVSGPTQAHLTLVDLPGLFQAGNKAQSDTDAQIVKSLVLSYMKKSRSIVLAVVSAKNDFANQIVTKYARELDPEGLRTLGIITKPDTLDVGSESERAFVELAENRDVYFRLGWHVLRNRDYDMRDCSAKERDEKEREFFSQGIWTSLPANHVGISSLKPRLSSLLKEQILAELPSLIRDITTGVEECKEILMRLGESRVTLHEQRLHLVHVSQEFSNLAKSAVEGFYVEEFFGSAKDALGYSKRLRAVIQNTCLEFSEVIRLRGHTKQIVDDSDKSVAKPGYPSKIHHSDYIKEVMTLMKHSRGCELPGTYNPLIIGNLFYEQSKNWVKLADEYTSDILSAARTTLNAILAATADETTGEGLLRYIINPKMDALQHDLKAMVASVLEPHQKGHPITYNHYFTDNIQKAKLQHRKKSLTPQLESFFGNNVGVGDSYVHGVDFDLKSLLSSLEQGTEADMDRYASSEAIDCMRAYYKVAMKKFVDDFSVLAVEKCLVKCLPDLLSPKVIYTLDDDTISSIAAETEESKLDRSRATEKLKVLESTLVVLRSLDRHKRASKSTWQSDAMREDITEPATIVAKASSVSQPEELDGENDEDGESQVAEKHLPYDERFPSSSGKGSYNDFGLSPETRQPVESAPSPPPAEPMPEDDFNFAAAKSRFIPPTSKSSKKFRRPF